MTLLIAYGNPGRGDDGLGPALAERLGAKAPPGLRIEIDYQLTVEHALLLAEATCVVFVDAEVNSSVPYSFSQISSAQKGNVTSHSLSPRTVLTLAKTLYGAAPPAYVLGISGSEFDEVKEGLSSSAVHNLDRAQEFFLDWLKGLALGQPENKSSAKTVQ